MNSSIIVVFSVAIITIMFCVLVIYIFNVSRKLKENDIHKMQEAVEKLENSLSQKEQVDIINIMYESVGELREYYVISKEQAQDSFFSALFICFAGVIIYALGIASYIIWDKDISVISVIPGTVVELISGLFFWLYKNTTKQLEMYYKRLESTEKYLVAYHMIQQVPEEHRYEEQRNYINFVLGDNQEQLKAEQKND